MAGTRRAGRMREAAQVSSPKSVYLIMKLKLPLLDLWLVTGRRLRAGHAYRYQQGYAKGWAAGSAEASRDAAEVRPHLGRERAHPVVPEHVDRRVVSTPV
jgi:hypothetical protein